MLLLLLLRLLTHLPAKTLPAFISVRRP